MLSDVNMSEMETCYKVIRTAILRDIQFMSKRFGFWGPVFTIKEANKQYRIYEVPISYSGRTYIKCRKIS